MIKKPKTKKKKKAKKQSLKEIQAQMQSDAVELDSWLPSDGIQYTGSFGRGTLDTLDPGVDISYSFGDLDSDNKDLFEEDLRKKYPALQDAYDHYQSVKRMCEQREKEEDEN